MSKGNTPRTLLEIMINTPDVLQLDLSSVLFTIKFYEAFRHPAGCVHWERVFYHYSNLLRISSIISHPSPNSPTMFFPITWDSSLHMSCFILQIKFHMKQKSFPVNNVKISRSPSEMVMMLEFPDHYQRCSQNIFTLYLWCWRQLYSVLNEQQWNMASF